MVRIQPTKVKRTTLKITKDNYYNTIRSVNILKIPHYSNLEQVGSNPGMEGNIILNRSEQHFYGHNGIEWILLGGAPIDADYVTVTSNSSLPNSRALTAGNNISINDSGPGGTLTLDVDDSAPIDADYVILTANSLLPNSRVLTAGTNISFSDSGPGGSITLNVSGTFPIYTRTLVNNSMSPYSVLQSDDILAVDTTAGPVIINLPQISSLATPNNYKTYSIVDEGGNAGSDNISVTSFAGDTIIGDTNVLINSDYNAITIYNDGNNTWFIR